MTDESFHSPAEGELLDFGPGDPRPGKPRMGRGKKYAATGLAALLVGGVAVAGVAFGEFLSGGGTQPEEVLPAATVAFAKIDLDPSSGQKLAAYQLLKKFPAAGANGKDLKQTLVEDLLKDNTYGISYSNDVAPWIGDRAAVAAVGTPGTKDKFAPLLALQFTDEATMRTDLARVADKVSKQDGKDDFHFAVRDDYVLIGDHQTEVDAFAKQTTPVLADATDFAADAKQIDSGNQIALAWLDLNQVYDLVPAAERRQLAGELSTTKPSGRIVLGLHVDSDAVEVDGQARGFNPTGSNVLAASHPGTSLVRGMPADVTGAMSLTGLGPAMEKFWNTYKANDVLGIGGQARQLGLKLPGDLDALFGTEFALGVKVRQDGGDVAVRVATDRPDRAQKVLGPVLSMTGEPDVQVVPAQGGYAAGTDKAMLDQVVAGSGNLGGSPTFQDAVPNAAQANALLYVDLAQLVDTFAHGKDKVDLAPLQALGMSTTGDSSDASFTIRLTVK